MSEEAPQSIAVENDNQDKSNTQQTNNNTAEQQDTPNHGPLQLGNLIFARADSLFKHINHILANTAVGSNVKEEDYQVIHGALKLGHENYAKKAGCGIAAIKAGVHPTHSSKCFMIKRTDGSEEDFSYIKCVHHIFPKKQTNNGKKRRYEGIQRPQRERKNPKTSTTTTTTTTEKEAEPALPETVETTKEDAKNVE